MVVYYSYSHKIKVDKPLGHQKCPNCFHEVDLSLAHESSRLNIFFIPVFFYKGWRMVFCPNCGAAKKLTKAEFKQMKKS